MAAGRRDSGGRGRARQVSRQRRHGLRRRGTRRSECVLLLLLWCERRCARRCGRERWRRQEVRRGRASDGRDGRDRVTVAVVVPVMMRRRLVMVVMVHRHGQLAVAARHSDTATAAAARKRRRRESGGGRGGERVRRRKEHNVVVGMHRQQHEFGGFGQRQTQVALIARGVWEAARARAIRCVQ